MVPNTYACKGVSNPNVPIFPPRVCTLVLFIIIVIFAENSSFTCKLRRHLLASMALTTPKPQKCGYQRNPRNVGMTLYYSRF